MSNYFIISALTAIEIPHLAGNIMHLSLQKLEFCSQEGWTVLWSLCPIELFRGEGGVATSPWDDQV